MKNLLLTCLLLVTILNLHAQHSIIPEPVSYKNNGESFVIENEINIHIETKDEQTIKYAHQLEHFLSSFGIEVSESSKMSRHSITIKLAEEPIEEIGAEGYVLDVKRKNIELSANSAAGIFNGIQTLKQLLPASPSQFVNGKSESIEVVGCTIVDYPRFAWRGLMLDVSRHFHSVESVKAYIDKMVLYKYNVFHWHLTDDQGWRIEIKSYPKLTEVGSLRVQRYGLFGKDRVEPLEGEVATDGGFYSQEDIKEVVRYAADRNVTIVPEIDVPGHAMALLAAYPEFASFKEDKFVAPGNYFAEWFADGSFEMKIENMLNPSDENVYVFLDKLFTEVAELFPGAYIHMGGDECYHGYWERNPEVQKFMAENKIETTAELQNYFVKRVEKIISSKGKKMIGWDEIIEGDISKETTIMGWQKMEGGTKAAKLGHDVVMTPTSYAYINYSQGDDCVENIIHSKRSLEESYAFEPVEAGVDPKYILGGQGNLWCEAVPTLQFAYYMTYPRAFSISETLWSPKEKKDWVNFITKTEEHFNRFDATNTNISKAIYEPIVSVFMDEDRVMCKLSNPVPDTEIYYTINNTYPVNFGTKYSEPFEIPVGDLKLRTQSFRDGQLIGRELIIPRKDLLKRIVK